VLGWFARVARADRRISLPPVTILDRHMDLTLIVVVIAAFGLGLLLALLVWGRRGSATENAGARADIREVSGRLAQMAESHAAVQARLAEQMQAQERALSKAVEERLTDFSKRIGERLQESSTQSQTTLTDLRERLAVIDRAQKNITELSSQVVGLQDVLSNKQARGAFGEVQMGDIVSAILPPSAYSLQATLTNGKRVDCLIRLPNPPGPIAIDSKFPLESYEALRAARDEAEKVSASRAFAAAVRIHVATICEKYIVPGETAESALMFLPSEAVYGELHANFRAVIEESYRARVWIVSPTTLMATLNTVRAVLKDVRMREQAGVIQQEVHTMLGDVARLDGRVAKLQRHFEQAGEDVRQIRISTEKVTKRAERITEMELEAPEDADGALEPPAEPQPEPQAVPQPALERE
jgi:DNA recombination protein RmuC